jgi:soluble lytic murein transglycosylase-like protein
VAAALALAGCAPPPAEAAPRLVATPAGVRWHGARLSGSPDAHAVHIERWWLAARDTGLAGTAVLVPLADTLAARGDTARADSLLAAPRLARSLWAWEALRRRAGFAQRAGAPSRAARLLDAAPREAWPDADEAAWRARRAELHLALRDTTSAQALARGVLEDHATVAPASGAALELLDRLARLRREPFVLRLERRAAEAEWANGRRDRALVRNARLLRRGTPEERGRDAVQRVRWLREWRRPAASLAASDTALRWTRGTAEFERARLERARSFRAAGRSDSALALYRRIGRGAGPGALRAAAWWEYARECQDESRWALAARAFLHADSVGRGTASASLVRPARPLAGLMYLMLGHEADAIAAWRGSDDRRARFWLGVTLRRRGARATERDAAEGGRILTELAREPGFDIYSVAARDTLGLPSWRGQVASPAADTLEPALVGAIVALSGPLALPDEAARLVAARDRGDARLPRGPQRGVAGSSWRSVAVAAYAGGDLAGATRAADRALAAAGSDSGVWEWVPWAFPPAFENELAAAADRFGIERALLWGLARQESRFDPHAISRSNALGLAQLLPGTAREVAKELGERLPSDSLLFEPDRGLRYGAHYLRKLLRRFDGAVPVALTAYNAGPGRVREDWRAIVRRGGWALYFEMAANADTQDYVRRILGFRQAYRELRPAAGSGP